LESSPALGAYFDHEIGWALMGVDRPTIDIQIEGACRDDADQIHQRPHLYKRVGCDRIGRRYEPAVGFDAGIGEEVYRLRNDVDVVAKTPHGDGKIFRATRMRTLMAEEFISELIACGDHHVMNAAGAILDDRDHGTAKPRDQGVAFARFYAECRDPAM